MRRREYLASTGAACAGTAGCVSLPGTGGRRGDGAWPQALHDCRNTSHAAGIDGPVEVAASRELDLESPVQFDGEVLVGATEDGDIASVPLDESASETTLSVERDLYSTTIVSEEAIVAGYAAESEFGLVSIDRSDESIRWEVPMIRGGHPRSAPAARDDLIVGFGHRPQEYVALDAADGSVLWRYGPNDVRLFARPAVGEEYVWFTSRVDDDERTGRVHCVDAATGEEEWRSERRFAERDWPGIGARGGDAWMDGPPMLDQQHVYVVKDRYTPSLGHAYGNSGISEVEAFPGQDQVLAFDRETGDHEWTADLDGIGGGWQFALAEDTIYVVDSVWNPDGAFPKWDAHAVQAFDAGSGVREWRTPVFQGAERRRVDDLVATDAHVYVAAGQQIAVLDRSNGRPLNTVSTDRELKRLLVTEGAILATTDATPDSRPDVLVLEEA